MPLDHNVDRALGDSREAFVRRKEEFRGLRHAHYMNQRGYSVRLAQCSENCSFRNLVRVNTLSQ
jgi:hypothetical protein